MSVTRGALVSGPSNFAPSLIQRSISEICAPGSGSSFCGIRSSSSRVVRRRKSSLWSGWPGRTDADLLSPPFIRASNVSSRKWPFDFSGPWQVTHFFTSIAAMSLQKPTAAAFSPSCPKTESERSRKAARTARAWLFIGAPKIPDGRPGGQQILRLQAGACNLWTVPLVCSRAVRRFVWHCQTGKFLSIKWQ